MKKLMYKIKNWKAYFRALFLGSYVIVEGKLAKLLGNKDRIALYGSLNANVIKADGSVLDLGCIGKRVVTTAGVNYLRDNLAAAAGGADISTFKYHGCGTGTTAEAIGDTALVTECTTALNPDSTRGVGTQSNSVAKIYSSVATMTFDNTAAITEHGIFNAATTGILLDRTVFAAINVTTGMSIQFTYSLTLQDGL